MKTIYQSPEEAVASLNQHKTDWYANPDRWPSDEYKWVLPEPDGDHITSLYRKDSPDTDWEWNYDADYLITNNVWPSDTAIFYDYDEETWHLATPSTDLPGAWTIAGTTIIVMDASIFPEELLPTKPPATAEEIRAARLAFEDAVQTAQLQAQMMHLLADRGRPSSKSRTSEKVISTLAASKYEHASWTTGQRSAGKRPRRSRRLTISRPQRALDRGSK